MLDNRGSQLDDTKIEGRLQNLNFGDLVIGHRKFASNLLLVTECSDPNEKRVYLLSSPTKPCSLIQIFIFQILHQKRALGFGFPRDYGLFLAARVASNTSWNSVLRRNKGVEGWHCLYERDHLTSTVGNGAASGKAGESWDELVPLMCV